MTSTNAPPDGTVLANVTVDHVWGDFVNFSQHAVVKAGTRIVTFLQNVTIEHSHFGLDKPFMGSGRQGINIDAGAYLHVHDNVIQYSSRSGVDMEPVSSGTLLREIYIEHNTFGPHAKNLFANHYYGAANPVIDGVYFRYNDLRGAGLAFDSAVPDISTINANDPSTFHRHNYQIIGNHGDTTVATGTCPGPNHALRFWGIDGLIVQDNVQTLGRIGAWLSSMPPSCTTHVSSETPA